MGVLVVLKFRFAKVVALAVSIGNNLRPIVAKIFGPALSFVIPKEYHQVCVCVCVCVCLALVAIIGTLFLPLPLRFVFFFFQPDRVKRRPSFSCLRTLIHLPVVGPHQVAYLSLVSPCPLAPRCELDHSTHTQDDAFPPAGMSFLNACCLPQWIAPMINYFCKFVAMTVAWWIQRFISTVQSAIKGGLLFARSLMYFISEITVGFLCSYCCDGALFPTKW